MKNDYKNTLYFISFLIFILFSETVFAADFSSTSFKVRDPVLEIGGGGEMTSESFKLLGSIGQISIGTSSSATAFKVSSGFLYFPVVTRPAATASAGDGKVTLSWTAATGFLGWNVSGYNIGRSTVSGGLYTFTASLGNITSSVISGLSNGTAYYFVVRAEDGIGNSIATSSEVSATPVAAAPITPPAVQSVGGGIIESLLKIFGVPAPYYIVKVTPCANLTDLDCDGGVDIKDLSILLYYAQRPTPNPADFNKDMVVDIKDLSILFSRWNGKLLTFLPETKAKESLKAKEFAGPQEKLASVEQAITTSKTASVTQETVQGKTREVLKSSIGFIIRVFEKIIRFWFLIFNRL